ncbi:alanine racemase [Corynebacterium halotolerans]|uniref:alanine racemase n=1 Tax=Corynebacterium halotolerans TaxID=225326 RepID=UPI003CF67DBF
MTLIPADVETPAVVIDRGRLERNIAAMAEFAGTHGLSLRPHAKTHKITEIARLQLAAGVTGLTVATIGEAEVFAEAGVNDIFIAYPLWLTDRKTARLRAVAERARVTIGVDSAAGAMNLSRRGLDDVGVLVELDSGHHRSGTTVDQLPVITRAVREAGLKVRGVFTFPGHSYAPDGSRGAAGDERSTLADAAQILADLGVTDPVLSGGSTPSALLTGSHGATEIRPGVYVFNDAQQLELGRCDWTDIALHIAATVVSRRAGVVVLDSGSKIVGSDRPAWASGFARIAGVPDARVSALSEHHATVEWPDPVPLPDLGEQLAVIPNHVCPVLNLVDEVLVTEDGAVTDAWQVAARGRNV